MTHRLSLTTTTDTLACRCLGICACSRRRSRVVEDRAFPNVAVGNPLPQQTAPRAGLIACLWSAVNLVSVVVRAVICVVSRVTLILAFLVAVQVATIHQKSESEGPEILGGADTDNSWEEELQQWYRSYRKSFEEPNFQTVDVLLLEDLSAEKARAESDKKDLFANLPRLWVFW